MLDKAILPSFPLQGKLEPFQNGQPREGISLLGPHFTEGKTRPRKTPWPVLHHVAGQYQRGSRAQVSPANLPGHLSWPGPCCLQSLQLLKRAVLCWVPFRQALRLTQNPRPSTVNHLPSVSILEAYPWQKPFRSWGSHTYMGGHLYELAHAPVRTSNHTIQRDQDVA